MGSKRYEEKQEEQQPTVTLAVDAEPDAVSEPKEETAASGTNREQLIYIGPSIRQNGVGIRTNQTFLGGHPKYFEPLYTAYPQIKALFVPVYKLQEAKKQISTTGTALNAAALSLKGV